MEWKREIHEQYGTTLVETYSYEKENGTLFSKRCSAPIFIGKA